MSAEVEEAKSFLRQADANGHSLYDHLSDVLLRIVKEKPQNALQVFESISAQVKNTHQVPSNYREIPAISQAPENKKKILDSLSNTQELYHPTPKEDEEQPENVMIPDILAEAELLLAAGVNLGKEEVYKIYLSIQRLANEHQLEEVRFWGKIMGLQKDYYVVEAKLKDVPEDAEDNQDPKFEPIGTGANQFVYFVANTVEGKWTRLPAVTPEQIILARQMRRYFTGDLTAPVLGFPRFPWSEASYLRAQIARITASTVISPKGYFSLDKEEEDPVMIQDEEFQGVSSEELLQPENWVHHSHHLLKQGRTKPWVEPEADEDEEHHEEKEEQEHEDEIPPLRSLDEDQATNTEKPKKLVRCWTFRVSPKVTDLHSSVSARNLLWPGAVAVARKKQFVNIYLGFGQKYLAETYTPPALPPIQSEFVSPFNPEEDEHDPLVEQTDPVPPAELPEEHEDDEEHEDEEEEEEDN